MSIRTIVRANIRAHKGQFIGIVLMMAIAVSSILGFTNVMISTKKSISSACDRMDVPDLFFLMDKAVLTPEMIQKIENNPDVSRVRSVETVGIHTIAKSRGTEPGKVYESTESDSGPKYMSMSYLIPFDGRYAFMENDMSDIRDDITMVNKGEIYFSSGILSSIDAEVGDLVDIVCERTTMTFRLAGLIEDNLGSSTMGIKHLVVSPEDYQTFYDAVHNTYDGMGFEDEYNNVLLDVYKADSEMSDSNFRRSLDDSTGIFDVSGFSMTREENEYYGALVVNIISAVLIGVAAILFIVLLVVISHNISSSMRTDYKTLGVLKSQGFSSQKLKNIYLCQYLFGEILGLGIGIVMSFIILKILLMSIVSMVGMKLTLSSSAVLITVLVVAVLMISFLTIMICASKVSRISPQKAISEGRADVSFSSRITTPVSKKLLSASLALRNVTSAVSQYLGVVMTSMILLILILFSFIGVQCLNSKNTLQSMGSAAGEIEINHYGTYSAEQQEHIRDIVASHAKIQSEYTMMITLATVNKNRHMVLIYEDADTIIGLSEGRFPYNDNEIVIASGIADLESVGIGDTLMLSNEGKSFEYTITGLFTTTNDVGRVMAMTIDAAENIGLGREGVELLGAYLFHGFFLENEEDPGEWYPQEAARLIKEDINEYLGTDDARVTDPSLFGSIGDFINMAIYSVYVVAIVFVIIIVTMACTKGFNNERRLLGVYKAVGFTSTRLRLQFAFRYAIVFAVGGVLGLVIGGMTVKWFYGLIFGILGAPTLAIDFVPSTYIIPLVVVTVSAFIFSYIASKKIRRIDVSELVME